MARLTEDQVTNILAADAAERQQRTDEILTEAGIPRRPRSAKVAAIRAKAARGDQERRPEFELRPLIEKALSKSKSTDPGDAVAEVLNRIRFEDRQAAIAAVLLCSVEWTNLVHWLTVHECSRAALLHRSPRVRPTAVVIDSGIGG